MNTLARLIFELLSIWERYKADQKRIKRDAAIKKARKDPADAFNDHFGGLHDDATKADKADKAEH